MVAVKKFIKGFKNEHILMAVGLVFLLFFLYQYTQNKNVYKLGMDTMKPVTNPQIPISSGTSSNVVGSSAPNSFAPYSGSSGTQPVDMQGLNKPASNPSDLLPSDNNNAWAQMNPVGDLKNINLLNPTQIVGINTQGSSLRNANLQLRSEPPNPRMDNIGPWNIPTIEEDKFRKQLEIGSPASSM